MKSYESTKFLRFISPKILSALWTGFAILWDRLHPCRLLQATHITCIAILSAARPQADDISCYWMQCHAAQRFQDPLPSTSTSPPTRQIDETPHVLTTTQHVALFTARCTGNGCQSWQVSTVTSEFEVSALATEQPGGRQFYMFLGEKPTRPPISTGRKKPAPAGGGGIRVRPAGAVTA